MQRPSIYKGIRIGLRPVERESGWYADFSLIEEVGRETVDNIYDGRQAYPSADTAENAALDSALRIIDEKY